MTVIRKLISDKRERLRVRQILREEEIKRHGERHINLKKKQLDIHLKKF